MAVYITPILGTGTSNTGRELGCGNFNKSLPKQISCAWMQYNMHSTPHTPQLGYSQ